MKWLCCALLLALVVIVQTLYINKTKWPCKTVGEDLSLLVGAVWGVLVSIVMIYG